MVQGTVIQIWKTLINDRLSVSEESLKFHIPPICNFTVIYWWNLLFNSFYFLTVSIVISVYKQNFTAQ